MAFQIIREDISNVKADAIVNTANPNVMVGPGVDASIYEAAGKEWLLNERAKIGRLNIGDVAVTKAGRLHAKYIFHESGPIWIDGNNNEIEILRQCYDKCLELAIKYHCDSIAFPLLASGAYGFPKDISLRIAIDAFRTFLSENELDILLVLYDEQSVRLSESMFDGVRTFVDNHYAERNFDGFAAAPMISYSMASDSCKAPKSSKKERKGFGFFGSLAKPEKSLDECVDIFEQQEVLSFGEYLQQLINKKGMTNKEVYFESNLTKQYFSKLINNKVGSPSKEKLLCIAVALKLNIDETKDFLLHAGYAISPYSKIDLVFEYYIRAGKYDVYEISFALEDLGIKGGLWPELL